MWRKYYEVQERTYLNSGWLDERDNPCWVIVYSSGSENAHQTAYGKGYRTEKLAIKGAERLYRRTHGWLEEAIGLDVV